jgi:hypothetical protein
MGVLKNVLASGLAYAEEKQVPKYVSSIRSSVSSIKSCDSVLTQVESLLSTHGPVVLDSVDAKVDPLLIKAKETYGGGLKKGTEVVTYAKETKDGVVKYTLDKKMAVYDTATKTTESAKSKARDFASKVQSGELKDAMMKKLDKQPVAKSMATRLVTLFAVATAYSDTLKTKADAKLATAKCLYCTYCKKAKETADAMLAKLPVKAAQEKVATVEKQVWALVVKATDAAKPYADKVQAKTAPYMEQLKPLLLKAKTEACKVYVKLMECKTTFTKKAA